MTQITERMTVCSEDGDRNYPSTIELTMDGSKPDCPVTIWHNGTPFFSLGSHEIHDFCKALQAMDCS